MTKSEHYHRHFTYGTCIMCYEKNLKKRMLKLYYSLVDPRNGLGYLDVLPNGNLPWPKKR